MTNPPAHSEIALDRLIGQVRGVMAARVVTGAGGEIDEIHIVGTPERSPKAMVRDVESLLYVRAGVRLDHRKISLVQMAEVAMPPEPARVLLADLALADGEGEASARVVLSRGERRVEGIGRGQTGESRERQIGRATVHALGQLLGSRGQLRLENLQIQSFGSLDVCLSHLSLLTDDGAETLLGVSMRRDGDPAAAARSVLDAVNRRLQRLLVGA